MKILKKICAIMLTVCALTSTLSGCARNEGGADVHVFYYTYSDTYISTVRAALDEKLSKMGIKYQDYDGNNSQTTQSEQIQTAVTKGAKLLVVKE